MTTMFNANYYDKMREELSKDRCAINPEKELEWKMSIFDKAVFDENSWSILIKIYANEVYKTLKEKLLEDKKTYLNVRKDSNCLGYISKIQEVQEAGRIVRIFEYNCFILGEFKAKYQL